MDNQDKIRTILKSLTQSVNIWLNKGLYVVKLAFVIIFITVPLSTQAGVFSFLSEVVGNTEVDASINTRTANTYGVLQANTGPSSLSGFVGAEISMIDGSALVQESGVNGTQADITDSKSTQISIYVVRQGDSLSQIAKMFGVSVNTIVWANNLKGPIREGDELIILPISGVTHKVVKGDTLRGVAAKYRADMNDIISFNDLVPGANLILGATIIIPDGEFQAVPVSANQPTEKLRNAGGPVYKNYYMRPIDIGSKSQGLHGYNAVDLAAPIGTPIYAAAEGTVIIARSGGYNGGYGSYVVISHPNGTQTLYGHASKVLVTQGQVVSRGDKIALLGNSGKSTGPHVHFEIRGAANPF